MMEVAVALLAGAVLILVAMLLRRERSLGSANSHELAVVESPSEELEQKARTRLEVVPDGTSFELRLAGAPLMQLEPVSFDDLPARVPASGTHAQWIATLLDNPRVIEFVGGQRWVVAKVPQAIRDGGRWMQTADGATKAVARAPGSGQYAAIADLVGGGAALGSVVVLGPAVIGAAAAAYAHHRIEAAIAEVHQQLKEIDLRMRDADMGVITGARRLIEEMTEWGPPHAWPQQLRIELAVRRAALDPVCFSQRREVERLISAMLHKGEKFIGLDEERRNVLARETQVLCLGTMVKAQLDYTTSMVLLDCDAAPFGLERLDLISRGFSEDMDQLRSSFQAAIDGKRPLILNPRKYTTARRTAPAVEQMMERVVGITSALSTAEEPTLILSIADDNRLEISVPVTSADGEMSAD